MAVTIVLPRVRRSEGQQRRQGKCRKEKPYHPTPICSRLNVPILARTSSQLPIRSPFSRTDARYAVVSDGRDRHAHRARRDWPIAAAATENAPILLRAKTIAQ